MLEGIGGSIRERGRTRAGGLNLDEFQFAPALTAQASCAPKTLKSSVARIIFFWGGGQRGARREVRWKEMNLDDFRVCATSSTPLNDFRVRATSSTALFGVPVPLTLPPGRWPSQLSTMPEREIQVLHQPTPRT